MARHHSTIVVAIIFQLINPPMHADGQFTVFASSSPTPMAGAIYILQPERVHPVDVPLRKAMVSVTKWGAGAAEMRAAIRSGSK